MKRILAIAAIASLTLGLVAAVAYAATQKDFGGPIKDGGTISFGAIRSSGKYTKAGEFVINKIPLKCTGGNTRGTFSTGSFVNVSSQRKFSYTFNFGGSQVVKVNGQFNSTGTKATGTVRASGVNFSGGHTNCHTDGAKDWKAQTYL